MARADAPILSGLRVLTMTTRRLPFTVTIITLKLALIGYGNVGRALARLLQQKTRDFPFLVTGIHTLRHGTAVDPEGLSREPAFGPKLASFGEFLEASRAEVAVELTTLNPATGEPAISHI